MDLIDEQLEVLEPLIPDHFRRVDGRGRPWRDARDVLNGILWVLRTGAPLARAARALPALPDLPPALPTVGRSERTFAHPRSPNEGSQ